MKAVHAHLPKRMTRSPIWSGVKLTPPHYAYLKIAEGCNHRCTFCIIPSMRGDLVSRPIGEVMQEAENLVKAGVKELLVISQDTSAYGVDIKYRTGFVHASHQDADDRPVQVSWWTLARGCACTMSILSARRRSDSAHGPRARSFPISTWPFQHASPRILS